MNRISVWFAVLLAAASIAGCAGQKEPATQAVASIEASLEAIRADASKYAADQLSDVESSFAELKDSFGKGDYKSVMAKAPALTSQVASLSQTVSTKKTEVEAAVAAASKEWQSLSADVPQMIAAVQSRVDVLSQSRRLPRNLSADTFKAAQDGLDTMKSTWAEATSSYGAGDPLGAVSKARAAKEKATEVMQSLGMG